MATTINQITAIGKIELTLWTHGNASTTGDETSLSTTDGGSLIGKPAGYDEERGKFTQQVTIQQNASFRTVPATITSGPFKGFQLIMLPPAGSFRFLDLPVELRNMVYKFFIPGSRRVRITTSGPWRRYRHGPARIVRGPFRFQKQFTQEFVWGEDSSAFVKSRRDNSFDALSLMQVNKQIHAEASQVLYSSNSFHFKLAPELRFFLNTNKYIESIRRVVVYADNVRDVRQCFKNLQRFPNLRTLEFDHTMICKEMEKRRRLRAYGLDAENLVNGFLPFLNKIWSVFKEQGIIEKKILDVVRLNDCPCFICEFQRTGSDEDGLETATCQDGCFSEQKKLAEEVKKVISRRFLGVVR